MSTWYDWDMVITSAPLHEDFSTRLCTTRNKKNMTTWPHEIYDFTENVKNGRFCICYNTILNAKDLKQQIFKIWCKKSSSCNLCTRPSALGAYWTRPVPTPGSTTSLSDWQTRTGTDLFPGVFTHFVNNINFDEFSMRYPVQIRWD